MERIFAGWGVDSGTSGFRRWPLLLLAAPAGVATWSGWVGLGGLAGFGPIALLPGIVDDFQVNTAITLPIGVEAYAAYALGAWLSSRPLQATTRRFAMWSALGSLLLGMLGQVAYHLLTNAGVDRAPWQITTLVSCLPVLVLGMGAGLFHLVSRDQGGTDNTETEGDETNGQERDRDHERRRPAVETAQLRGGPGAANGSREPGDQPSDRDRDLGEGVLRLGQQGRGRSGDLPAEHLRLVEADHEDRAADDTFETAALRLMTKADAVRYAFNALGTTNVPAARAWLAERGVHVDRAYAYTIEPALGGLSLVSGGGSDD
jgi:hypothetical protein